MTDEIEQAFREGYLEGKKETAELKRLLRLAMEDMSEMGFCCYKCIHRHTGYDKCADDNCFEWKHADEAEKLLEEKE